MITKTLIHGLVAAGVITGVGLAWGELKAADWSAAPAEQLAQSSGDTGYVDGARPGNDDRDRDRDDDDRYRDRDDDDRYRDRDDDDRYRDRDDDDRYRDRDDDDRDRDDDDRS